MLIRSDIIFSHNSALLIGYINNLKEKHEDVADNGFTYHCFIEPERRDATDTQHIQTPAYAGIHTTIIQTKRSSAACKIQYAKYRHIILPVQNMDTHTHTHALTGRLFFFLSFSFSLFWRAVLLIGHCH